MIWFLAGGIVNLLDHPRTMKFIGRWWPLDRELAMKAFHLQLRFSCYVEDKQKQTRLYGWLFPNGGSDG